MTGGAGYIGSHICKCLAARGIEPVAYDNLSRGHRDAVRWGPFVHADLSDLAILQQTIDRFKPDAVMHLAAFAYVAESIVEPVAYYRNNVIGTLILLDAMRTAGIDKLVFSSSCATYGLPRQLPVAEDAPQVPISPYGRSKLMIEQILLDTGRADGLRSATLRYFNAAGADPKGDIGECHTPETHLIPRALMAASGRIPLLEVFGDDYPTPDGSCIRDYVHVTDLAIGHVQALDYLDAGGESCYMNLGAGRGTSVRDVLDVVARVTGHKVPVLWRPRREGDPPAIWADSSRARDALGFTTPLSDIETIVQTAWRYMKAHAGGSRRSLAAAFAPRG